MLPDSMDCQQMLPHRPLYSSLTPMGEGKGIFLLCFAFLLLPMRLSVLLSVY